MMPRIQHEFHKLQESAQRVILQPVSLATLALFCSFTLQQNVESRDVFTVSRV